MLRSHARADAGSAVSARTTPSAAANAVTRANVLPLEPHRGSSLLVEDLVAARSRPVFSIAGPCDSSWPTPSRPSALVRCTAGQSVHPRSAASLAVSSDTLSRTTDGSPSCRFPRRVSRSSLSVVPHHVREPSAAHRAVHERDLDGLRAEASCSVDQVGPVAAVLTRGRGGDPSPRSPVEPLDHDRHVTQTRVVAVDHGDVPGREEPRTGRVTGPGTTRSTADARRPTP